MGRNLLKNPNGDEDLEFWELTENGGSQWKVEDLPGDCGHDFVKEGVSKYFATSFEEVYFLQLNSDKIEIIVFGPQKQTKVLCLKRQVINLLEEGYSADDLDGQPNINISDWYCARTDCGCTYEMTVCLLDENQELIQEFKPEPVTLNPESDDCSWKEISHCFSEYGPGLRFISFEHGGHDTNFWDGWFGVRVTASSVSIEL